MREAGQGNLLRIVGGCQLRQLVIGQPRQAQIAGLLEVIDRLTHFLALKQDLKESQVPLLAQYRVGRAGRGQMVCAQIQLPASVRQGSQVNQ